MLAALHFLAEPVIGDSYIEYASTITLIALLVGAYRKVNCHEPSCWRIGKHRVEGTPYITCHRHHPGLVGNHVRAGHIQAAHNHLKGTP